MTGEELKKLRLDKGLSQDELSKATGVPKGTIGRIEASNEDIKKIDVLNAFNKFFNIEGFNKDYTDQFIQELKARINDKDKIIEDKEEIIKLLKEKINN